MLLNILCKGTKPVYNVGGISNITVKSLADMIAAVTGSAVSLGEKSTNGAPDAVGLDMSRTLSEFPITFTDLQEGLARTISYQKNIYG